MWPSAVLQPCERARLASIGCALGSVLRGFRGADPGKWGEPDGVVATDVAMIPNWPLERVV